MLNRSFNTLVISIKQLIDIEAQGAYDPLDASIKQYNPTQADSSHKYASNHAALIAQAPLLDTGAPQCHRPFAWTRHHW